MKEARVLLQYLHYLFTCLSCQLDCGVFEGGPWAWPIFGKRTLRIVTGTGLDPWFARPSLKWKFGTPCSKIKNIKSSVEPFKHRALFSHTCDTHPPKAISDLSHLRYLTSWTEWPGNICGSIRQHVWTDSQTKLSTRLTLSPFSFACGHYSDCQEVNRHSCRKTEERGRRNTYGSSMHVEQKHKNILLFFSGGTICVSSCLGTWMTFLAWWISLNGNINLLELTSQWWCQHFWPVWTSTENTRRCTYVLGRRIWS